eukprot:symbB.v1.2.000961.t1/scaffold39.1/size394969/5
MLPHSGRRLAWRATSQWQLRWSSMRAVLWHGDPDPAKMKVERIQKPRPKKGEVLVKVRACGVCHTDLHCIKKHLPFPSPAVFGHEISGTVVEHGEDVNGSRLPIGGKVACTFIMPCGSCFHCKRGEEDTCAPFFALNRLKGQLYDGTTRLFSDDDAQSPIAMYSFAGLAEYAVVPETAAFLLPPILAENNFPESSLLGCAFFTAMGAIRNAADLRSGQSTVIIGAGGVGQGIVQLAKHLGATPIIAVDISEKALAMAKDFGADHCINASKEDVLERIAAVTDGYKADVCIEVIGSKATFEQAVMSVRDGGRACYVGIASATTKAEVPITHLVRRRISLVGSYGARASKDMPELLQIAAEGGVDLKSAVTRRFSMDQAAEAYSLLDQGKIAAMSGAPVNFDRIIPEETQGPMPVEAPTTLASGSMDSFQHVEAVMKEDNVSTGTLDSQDWEMVTEMVEDTDNAATHFLQGKHVIDLEGPAPNLQESIDKMMATMEKMKLGSTANGVEAPSRPEGVPFSMEAVTKDIKQMVEKLSTEEIFDLFVKFCDSESIPAVSFGRVIKAYVAMKAQKVHDEVMKQPHVAGRSRPGAGSDSLRENTQPEPINTPMPRMLYGLGHTMGSLSGEDVCLWKEGAAHQEDQALGEHGPPHKQLASLRDWEWHHLGARWKFRGGCSVCPRRCLIQIGQGFQTEACGGYWHWQKPHCAQLIMLRPACRIFCRARTGFNSALRYSTEWLMLRPFYVKLRPGLSALRTARKNRLQSILEDKQAEMLKVVQDNADILHDMQSGAMSVEDPQGAEALRHLDLVKFKEVLKRKFLEGPGSNQSAWEALNRSMVDLDTAKAKNREYEQARRAYKQFLTPPPGTPSIWGEDLQQLIEAGFFCPLTGFRKPSPELDRSNAIGEYVKAKHMIAELRQQGYFWQAFDRGPPVPTGHAWQHQFQTSHFPWRPKDWSQDLLKPRAASLPMNLRLADGGDNVVVEGAQDRIVERKKIQKETMDFLEQMQLPKPTSVEEWRLIWREVGTLLAAKRFISQMWWIPRSSSGSEPAGPLYRKLNYSDEAIRAFGLDPDLPVGAPALGAAAIGADSSTRTPLLMEYPDQPRPPITVENVNSVMGKDSKKKVGGKEKHIFWAKTECGLVLSSVTPWQIISKEKGVTTDGYMCKHCQGFWKQGRGATRLVQIIGRNRGKKVSLQLIMDEPPEALYNQWIKDRIFDCRWRCGVDQDLVTPLTWHSFRVFIPDCAYQLGIPRAQRQYLGNWQTESTADIYTREKRNVVVDIWSKVLGKIQEVDLQPGRTVREDLAHPDWDDKPLDKPGDTESVNDSNGFELVQSDAETGLIESEGGPNSASTQHTSASRRTRTAASGLGQRHPAVLGSGDPCPSALGRMAAAPDLSQIPPSDIPDALQDGIAKLSAPLKQLLMMKSVPYLIQHRLGSENYVTVEDLADRWDSAQVARQQGPRELGFEADHNGFTAASSGFAAMKLFQVVRAAKEMIQTHPSVMATPGPGPSRPLSLTEVLCERPQLEKEFSAKWGIPKPQYRDQGSDALLRRQYKFCSKGEIGFIHSKYIISALPEEGERPIKTRKKITVDGWEKEEEEEERAAPTTRRQLERLHLVFRNTLLMCLAAFPQFPQFNLTKEDLDSFYDWFYGPELGGRLPSPPEQTLLMAERNAWREVHESMHGGMYLKEALDKVQNNSLFWMREVYERVISERAKGKSKKGKDKKGSWGYPIRQPLWEKKGKGHGDKGGKGKGKGKSRPSDWPSNWAFKNPKGVPFCRDYFIKKTCQGQCGRSHNCPVVNSEGQRAQARELPSQGLKGSDGCRWRCGASWKPGGRQRHPGQRVLPTVAQGAFNEGPILGRAEDLVWGLPTLTASEQEEVDGESLLILRQMFLTTLMKQNCSLPVASFLEHPRDPVECSSSPSASRCSSLWATKMFKAWYPTVGHTLVKFDQCRLGQLVPKATCLSSDLAIQCWDGLSCNHPPHKLPEDMQSSDLSRYPPPMMQGVAAISQALSDIGQEASKPIRQIGHTNTQEKHVAVLALLKELEEGKAFSLKAIEKALGKIQWATATCPMAKPFLQPFWAWKSAVKTAGVPGKFPELTGLMYRQMSGRAGRRGFDLLGQVIFLDKPFSKIQRLITSDLSTLAGEFTLSPTILLRALHEWETVSLLEEDGTLGRPKAEIAKCLAPVFTLPFFQSKTAELVTQVAFHSRFSLEFLYQEGLINRDGTTRNLANLCAHLFEAEPANLIFGRLLSSGLLHEYLNTEAFGAPKMVKGDRKSHLTVKLASVLAWIFFRLRLPPNVPTARPRKKFLPSEGCPKLPPLPARIRKEIQQYNKQLFEIFQQFAWAVAVTRRIGETDVTLPTSQRSFRHKLDERGEPFDGKDGAFGPELFGQLVKYKARSPFSALGGVGDQFRSPVDLCKNCRNVLHLDLNAIPTVACLPNGLSADGELEATNSWLVDYMIHGQRKYLWEDRGCFMGRMTWAMLARSGAGFLPSTDNGINATRAWKLIAEFIEMLKKAHKAFKAFAPEKDVVLTTFGLLAEELEKLQAKTQKG